MTPQRAAIEVAVSSATETFQCRHSRSNTGTDYNPRSHNLTPEDDLCRDRMLIEHMVAPPTLSHLTN